MCAEDMSQSVSKLFGSRRGASDLQHDIPPPPPENPVYLPVDDEGTPAVYGVYQGKAMHGPVDFDQIHSEWDEIGKEYMDVPLPYAEKLGQLGSYVEDILPESAPLNRKQMNFLKGKGYTFVRKLGRGGYGDVYLAREYREDWVEGRKVVIDRQVACKVLLLKRMKEKRQSLERGVDSITREEDIYQDLQHINIVERTAVTVTRSISVKPGQIWTFLLNSQKILNSWNFFHFYPGH
jgi:hypothetical protein